MATNDPPAWQYYNPNASTNTNGANGTNGTNGTNGNANTNNNAALRDPYTQELITTLGWNATQNGSAPPGLINTDPTGDPGTGIGTGKDQTEYTPVDTGIRESILRQADAAFQSDLDLVQRNAERRRQTRSGVTSQNELEAARIAQSRRIGMLGEFETQQRNKRADILSAQAISARQAETQVQISREQIIANQAIQALAGDQKIAQIKTAGSEERATQAPRLLLQRQEATGQISGTGQITMDLINSEIFDEDGNVNLDLVNGIIGAERHRELAELFTTTDKDGNEVFDAEEYNKALLSEVFTASLVDPNKWNAAIGFDDTEASLAFERVKLEGIQVELAKRNQLFNERVVEAQLTGIWQAYSVDEMDDFHAAYYTVSAGGTTDETFNMSIVDPDAVYESKYDFDGDGDIDFSDFLDFADAAAAGGIETLAMQTLREDTRQFDITTKNGMDQFRQQIDTMVSEGNLSREQERYLTAMTLSTNAKVQELGLDVERLVAVMEFLEGEGIDALPDSEVDALINIVMDGAQATEDTLSALNLQKASIRRSDNFSSLFEGYVDNPDLHESGFMGIQADNPYDWFEVAIASIGEVSSERRQAWLEAADIDGDGDITGADQFYYGVLTE